MYAPCLDTQQRQKGGGGRLQEIFKITVFESSFAFKKKVNFDQRGRGARARAPFESAKACSLYIYMYKCAKDNKTCISSMRLLNFNIEHCTHHA